MTKRRQFTPEFKARVVLEMLTEQKSASRASREYGIKDSVLSRWKQEFIERSPMLFEQNAASDDRDQRIVELERMVGRMAMEEEEAATSPHGSEVIGWFAVEAGIGDWGGHAYEVMYTGNVVADSWHQVGFGQQFGQAPRVMGGLVSCDGRDSAHLRYDHQALTASGVAVKVEETPPMTKI